MDSFTCDESLSDVIGLSEFQIKHIIGFGFSPSFDKEITNMDYADDTRFLFLSEKITFFYSL